MSAEQHAPPAIGLVNAIKPIWAFFATLATTAANGAVWMDVIKGWAAFATVVIGAPTALFICVYWAIKTFRLLKGKE